ncbi:hypothetical protein JCM5296_001741 [Sporobolomyces johnsonii]
MLHSMSTSPPPAKNSVDWGSRLYHKVWRSLVAQGIRPFKIMCWVAVDRGLRLADKRLLPCPHRNKWLETRDAINEEI